MKAKQIILFFLLLSALIPPINAADYGEDEPYLGQVIDDYETDDNVTAAYNVIHNETLDCMELNYSTGAGMGMILQDFEDYTEVDEGNGITVVSDVYVDAVIARDWDRYVYYDFGVDYFGNFKHYGKFRQDWHNPAAWGGYSYFSNFLGNEQQHRNNNEEYVCMFIGGDAGVLGLREYTGAGFFATATKTVVDDTFYWFKMEKTGTLLELDVYTSEALRDAEGNGDWHDVQLTLHSDYSFRYFYVCNSHDDSQGQEKNMESYDNYLNGTISGYENSGHYYTAEMLDGDTGLVLMYNVTIPEGTGGTVEFSTDNVTWVDHHNLPGSDTLIAGFGSLDLRDINESSAHLRFNFTSDGSDTLRMYQIRFVTITNVTLGNGDGETVYVDTLFPGLAIGISLLIIMVILAFGKGR